MDKLKPLIDFVEGTLTAAEFEKTVYSPDFEDAVAGAPPPQDSAGEFESLYLFVISRNFHDIGDMYELQNALERYLWQKGINVTPRNNFKELHDLMLVVQPAWLDISSGYFERLLEQAGERKGKALKDFLKKKILDDYRCLDKKPKWLQSPQWPVEEGIPLVFVGQLDVTPLSLFHDLSQLYVFFNEKTKGFVHIVQQM